MMGLGYQRNLDEISKLYESTEEAPSPPRAVPSPMRVSSPRASPRASPARAQPSAHQHEPAAPTGEEWWRQEGEEYEQVNFPPVACLVLQAALQY